MLVCVNECLGFKKDEVIAKSRFKAIHNGILGMIMLLEIDDKHIPIDMLDNFKII